MDIFRNDIAARSLEKALDGLSVRSQAISNNVANVDTPNFKSSEVNFEQSLQAAIHRPPEGLQMATTHGSHIGGFMPLSFDDVQPRTVQMGGTSVRNDGNNVDIDREMSRLSETQISFQAATQMLSEKYRQYKQAIWEGKK